MNRIRLRYWLCALLAATACPLFAASYTTSQSGNWSSASTWGGAGVPGSGDFATVNHSVTLDVDVTVNTLTLNNSISGAHTLTVSNTAQWNGGTVSGGLSFNIPSGATMSLLGFPQIDGSTLTIGGTFNLTSSYYFYLLTSAQLVNNGTINFQGDNGIYVSGSGTQKITNNGTIEKTGGTGGGVISVPITANSGSQLLLQSGNLNVGSVTAASSTFSVVSGSNLNFSNSGSDSRSFDAASTISGAGTVAWVTGSNNVSGTYNVTGSTVASGGTTTITSPTSLGDLTVSGATLTINSAGTVSVPSLSMNSGTLTGTAPLTVTSSSMTWTGGTIAGTGALTIPAGTTITLNGYVYYDTRAVTNNGAFVYSSSYYSYFYNGASFTNNGTVTFQGDGGFYIGSGSPSVVNNGTITKSGGSGNGGIQVPLTANSGSQLQIQSGTLLLGNVTSSGATLSVSSGATAEFYYTTTASFDSSSTISGAGTVLFAAGTNTISAAYNVTGTTNCSGGTTSVGTSITSLGALTTTGGALTVANSSVPSISSITVSGGTLTLNIGATISVPTLTMNGGTLAGSAPISLTGTSMTWTGGTVGGSGALSISASTSIALNGYVNFDTRAITNNGALTYSNSYYSYFYNGASFTNNGSVTFQGDGGFYIGSGSPSLVNNGTITKSGGTGNGGMQVSLTANSGSQINIQSGTLLFGNVSSSGSTLSVTTGATAWFYYTTTATFDSASTISGAGSVQFGAGTNTISAAYSIGGTTSVSGGTTTLGTSITSLGNLNASGGALTINNSSAPTIGNITVSGGTLTLNIPTTLSIPALTMSGGTLAGTASISLTSASMTWTGGTIGGSGSLTIPGGTAIAVNGYVNFDTRTITNGGSLTYSSNYYSYLYNGASFTNNGTVTFQGDGGFYIGSGSPSVVNNGTITKSGGTGSGGIQVALTASSGSQLNAQSGTFLLGNVTASSAAFSVSSGATLQFYYTTTASLDASSSISGAGNVFFSAGTNTIAGSYNVTGSTSSSSGTTTLSNIAGIGALNVSGGTLTLNSASTLSVTTLTISGGTLGGTAPIAVSSAAMSWSGGTLTGSGAITIPNTTTITLTYVSLDGRPVTNNGTINMVSSGYMYLGNNAVLTNNGTIDLQGDSNLYLSGVAGTTAINNNGTLKKSAGASGSSISVPLLANSGSQQLVQSSILYVGNITATGATFTLSSGTTLLFYYTSTASFDAASSIAGPGGAQWNAGTTTFNGTITAPITCSGGTLTLSSASAQTIPTLSMSGGTLNGTAAINLTGTTMTWTGGTLGGSGTLSIPNGTTINITGYPTIDTRPITNAGTINLTTTNYVYLQNNAVLTNNGTIDFQSDGSMYLNGAAGSTAVVNNGTIKKSGGTNTTTFTVPLTANSGSQWNILSGLVNFGAISSTGATFTVASGAFLYGSSSDTRTFDATSSITGAGSLQMQGGTTTIAGTVSTSILASGGTITVNSAATQSIPTLVMGGGTFDGSANVSLTGTAMTWTGGTVGGSGTLSIPAGATVSITGYPYFDGRPVTNAGTILFTTTNYAYVQNNAVITNSGTINFQSDGAMYLNGTAGTTAVVNSGTIKKSGGAGSTYFTVPLTAQSGSQFLVQSGTVQIGAVTATSATFNIASGTTLVLYSSDNRTLDAASSVSGSGTLQVQSGTTTIAGTITTNIAATGGTLTINSAAAQSVPTLALSGGTVNGSATINLTGATMAWTGGTIGGSGTLNIPAGTTVSITGYPYFDGRTVNNSGTISFPNGTYSYVQNNAVITNNGTIDFASDANLYLNGATGTTAVVNNGTIKKSAGGSYSQLSVPLTLGSGSQLLAQSGILYISTSIVATGATLGASSGAKMEFASSDTRTFDAATSFNGSGTYQFDSGTNSVSGTFAAPLTMSGGTLSINSAAAQSLPTLTMNGGTLNGTAAVNVTGSSTWSGGTLSGSAALTIAATATINDNGYVYLDGRPLTNNGTIRLASSVYLYLQNNAALTNNGTIDFQADGSLYQTIAPTSLTNNGTIVKSAGTGTSSLSLPLTNASAGTIQAASGTLAISNTFSNAGTLYFPIAGATSFGTLNVSGNFALAGTLKATTVSGYTPPNGTTFHVLDFGSSSGSFANKLLDYPSGTFVESYAPTSLILSAGPQALAITSVSPARGTSAGGTTVSITGSDFVNGTAVTFGGVAATSVTYNNSTSLTAVTPAGTAGPVDVVLTNPSTQTATLANGYTFTGLVSHYSFDVAGTPGKDVAGSNDATSVTNVAQTSGKVGQAGSFSAGWMDLPNSASLMLRANDFTLDAFVKSSLTTNGNWFTKASAGPTHEYGLGTGSQTKAVFSFDGGSGGSAISTTDVFDGNWHHVAGVKRGAQLEIWVDGKLESSGPVTGSAESAAFALGREGSCCESFNGLIDEAKIYNYALSASEIRTDAGTPDVAISKTATPSATVGQPITYTLTVGNGGPVSATGVTVTDALPVGTTYVSATTTQGTCSGTATVTCSLGTLINGGTATITITATATSAGTIANTASVTANETDPLTSNNSSSASTVVTALSCATPTISAGGPTTFCAGGSVTLTANATGASAYQWYRNNTAIPSASASTYNATSSGSYTVQVTYPTTCSAVSSATAVTVNPLPPAPAITANGPTTFCTGGSVILSAPAGYSYHWSTGATTQSITVSSSGSYTVTVTDANGCSATSAATTVTVSAPPATPTITPSGPTTFCPGNNVTLTAPAGYTYLWSNGATTQSITVNASGSYTVTVTDGNGCSATSAATNVTVTPLTSPTVTPSGATTFCAGGSVTLTAQAGFAHYAWSNGATTQSINVTASGSYTVTVTDASGCVATSAATAVTVHSAPAVVISGPSAICAGNSVTLDAGPGFASYLWSTGATTRTITDTPSGFSAAYSVTVTDGNGCSNSASKTVAIGASLVPSITGPSAACPGNAFTLDAGAGYSSYLWSNGATTQTITVTQSVQTTYSVTVTTAACSGSASKTVAMSTPPSVTISGPASVCANASFTLDAGPGFASYLWSNGATTQSITLTQAAPSQTYGVTVTDANGCSNSASKSVTATNAPSAVITAPASAPANATGLTASVPAGPAGTTYAWSISGGTITAGQGTPSITFAIGNTNAALSVTVTSGSCTAAGTKTVALLNNNADLAIGMTAAPDPVAPGGTLTYTLQVTNNGPSSATTIAVNDTLPAGISFVSASGASCNGNDVSVQCSTPSLASGNTLMISIVVKAPNAGGTITNKAKVSSATPDPNSGNDVATTSTTVSSQPSCPSAGPTLVAPADGATVTSPVTLQWTAVSGASSYDVFAATAAAAPSLAGSTASTSLSAPFGSGTTSWYVVAHVPSCTALASATAHFTIAPSDACGQHTAPQLTAPAANATVASPVTFTWQPVAQATGYRVWTSTNGAPDEDLGTTTQTTFTHNVAGGSITWFVDALFAGCPSTRSERVTFNVPKPDPCAGHTAPSPVAPANNATTAQSSIDFQWTAAAGASGYRLWASIDGTAAAVLGETDQTSLHAVISSGAVDWYVEALFDGCPSLSSTHFTFTVPKAQSCGDDKPSPVAPADHATTTNSSVPFSWNGVAAATGYELWLALDDNTPVLIGTTTGATTLTRDVAPGALRWFVRANFNGCPPRDSQSFRFTYAPPANCDHQRPILGSPIDGAATVISPVSFDWSDVGASAYNVWLAGAAQPLGTTTKTHLDGVKLANGPADWYVEALFDGCSSLRSTSSHFTVVAPPASCITPEKPVILAAGEVSSGVPYKVRWLPALGADSYLVQEAASASFADAAAFPTNDNKLTFSHTNPGPGVQTFFYRVRGLSSCTTDLGPYSAVTGVSILPPNASEASASPDAPALLTYAIPLDAALAGRSFTATASAPFLTVNPPSGVVPPGGMSLTVTANTAGLPLGTSLGSVTISTASPSSARVGTQGNSTTTSTTLTVNVVQPVSPTPKSSPPPDALIIPAVAHADGFNAHFQSDVRLTNTSPQVMKYQITFTPSGEDGLANGRQAQVDVDPGRTIALDDILRTWFSDGTTAGATGTLEIRPLTQTAASVTNNAISGLANLVTFASSRTFNATANGTYGQFIPAIPYANFIGKSSNTSITLQQIAQSSAFRTNLGIVEGSGQAASLSIGIFGSDGKKITDVPLNINGGQHIQLDSFLAKQGLTLQDGRIEVKVTSGSGRVTAYASVLDNQTSDPLLVTPTVVSAGGSAKYVVPGVADLNSGLANWRTDMRLFNASSKSVDALLELHSQSGNVVTQRVTLSPNEVRQFDNLLSSTFGITNDGGALHVSTATPVNLIATARTYNQTSNGTYGQFISGVTPNDAAAVGTRPLHLLQVEESDRYRSNIGLAEVSGKPAKVMITVVPPDSKVSASTEVDLGPNEFRQLGSFLKSFGLQNTYNARVSVQVIEGEGRVTAYASVIDAQTQDPTYVPAQ
jgi:large repetitive protein